MQFLRACRDIIAQIFRIDRLFLVPDDLFAVSVRFFLVIREFDGRTGQGLGVTPALGYFGAASVSVVLALADQALDHGQGNQQQQGDDCDKGDLEEKGGVGFHMDKRLRTASSVIKFHAFKVID